MTCIEFQHSLDEGRPSPDAIAHAATCANCDRELRATEELERLLAVVLPDKVSPGFNDAVMRRLHDTPSAAFVALLAEPTVPLSVAIAIVMAWLLPALTIHVAFALAPVLFVLSWGLFRVYERMTAPDPVIRPHRKPHSAFTTAS
jgi:hypothetical protein